MQNARQIEHGINLVLDFYRRNNQWIPLDSLCGRLTCVLVCAELVRLCLLRSLALRRQVDPRHALGQGLG